MNLTYTLPDREAETLRPFLKKEPVIYCIPCDMTREGELYASGWTVVTRRHLYLLADGLLKDTVDLEQTEEILCSPQVNCGLLLARVGKEERLLCRFSMRHMVRYSYVARGATLFCRQIDREVQSVERELHCSLCGRALPGTNQCSRCAGRGRSFRRMWDLCRHYTAPLLLITLFMAGISALNLGQQSVLRDFIDQVLVPAEGTAGQLSGFLVVMLAILAGMLLLSVGKTLWSNSLGTRIAKDLRERVFTKISSLSMTFLNSRETGELMNRVVEDSARVREFMEQIFANMFTQIFVMAGALVMMLVINWQLALLTLAFAPLALLLVRLFRKKERRLWRQQWRINDKVNGRLEDVIAGIRVVKSFGQEKRETERFQEYIGRQTRIQQRNETFWATLYPFVTFLITSGTFFVLYFGGRSVLNETMTPGQLVQFMAYANMIYMPLQFLSHLPRMLMRVTTALERIYDVLDEQADVVEAAEPVRRDIVGDIVFEDVTFGYHSYEPVLEHINLHVEPGEMIGLVGASGTGKSTMINLLMRLYDADDGRLLIDGVPIGDYAQDCLHGQTGVVLQETFLFSGTIFDNIRFARPSASAEEVIRAAKMANAHEFIVRFPDGYDTYVGERGYTLSGGERQRIAIARAILHNPRLLILDEATSSLDTETEYQIQQAMNRLTKGRTTIAIAHRLSTLREADRIVVLDRHCVAESGTHNELMRSRGIYYGLVMAQLEMHKVRGANDTRAAQ
ncbi:MAG: ABC transporter ATP-binding protein [Clostridiales bacterium]|nr:ABC transporter ATP-binding protein [Clostridiales bacterium]